MTKTRHSSEGADWQSRRRDDADRKAAALDLYRAAALRSAWSRRRDCQSAPSDEGRVFVIAG